MIKLNTTLQEVMRMSNWQEVLEFLNLRCAQAYNMSTGDTETLVSYRLEDRPKFEYKAALEARGPIFDKDGYYLCRPFTKFFNAAEKWTEEPSNDTPVSAVHKLDGSLIKVWVDYSTVDVRYSTNAAIDAMRTNMFHGKSLGQMFKEALGDKLRDFEYQMAYPADIGDASVTHLFELVSPDAKIVVDYPETMIYYLGCILNATGEEIDYFGEHRNWFGDGEFKISDFCHIPVETKTTYGEAKEMLDEIGSEEGLVVKFGDSRRPTRIKLKRPTYVAAHHLKGKEPRTTKRLVEYYFAGEAEEISSYFPELRENFDMLEVIEKELIDELYNTARSKGDAYNNEKDTYLGLLDHFQGDGLQKQKAVQVKRIMAGQGTQAKVRQRMVEHLYDVFKDGEEGLF